MDQKFEITKEKCRAKIIALNTARREIVCLDAPLPPRGSKRARTQRAVAAQQQQPLQPTQHQKSTAQQQQQPLQPTQQQKSTAQPQQQQQPLQPTQQQKSTKQQQQPTQLQPPIIVPQEQIQTPTTTVPQPQPTSTPLKPAPGEQRDGPLLTYPPGKGGYTMYPLDMKCLEEGRYINDTVVNVLLTWSRIQCEPEHKGRIRVVDSHWYEQLTRGATGTKQPKEVERIPPQTLVSGRPPFRPAGDACASVCPSTLGVDGGADGGPEFYDCGNRFP